MASPFMGAPAVPQMAAPPPEPIANSQAVAQAQLGNLQMLMAQSGRESTMLTPQATSNKLGG